MGIKNTDELLARITELEAQLFEANSLIEAIRDGDVDAIILNKNGTPEVYSLESIDYTYRILIEKFGEGALSISKEGLILYCNSYFSNLVNIPISKLIGTYFNSYVASVGEFQQLIQELGSGVCKGEITLSIKGKKLPVYISLTSLQPHLPAIGIIVTDLTQQKKQERTIIKYQQTLEHKVTELNQTNSDLEQFVHIISHDIKEPLRKIVSYCNFLQRDYSPELKDRNLKNLAIICNSALRLNRLVDDLVKYSSLSTNTELHTSETDLMKVVSDVIADLELIIQESGAVITYTALPKITASEVQMQQLFANLITNAIKYSKAGVAPHISITAALEKGIDEKKKDKEFYKICLKDNGIGIENAYLEKIFTIFQRLHLPNEYSGTGIGLAICKKIMENHKGKIDVESTVNEGSTFILYLPIESDLSK